MKKIKPARMKKFSSSEEALLFASHDGQERKAENDAVTQSKVDWYTVLFTWNVVIN